MIIFERSTLHVGDATQWRRQCTFIRSYWPRHNSSRGRLSIASSRSCASMALIASTGRMPTLSRTIVRSSRRAFGNSRDQPTRESRCALLLLPGPHVLRSLAHVDPIGRDCRRCSTPDHRGHGSSRQGVVPRCRQRLERDHCASIRAQSADNTASAADGGVMASRCLPLSILLPVDGSAISDRAVQLFVDLHEKLAPRGAFAARPGASGSCRGQAFETGATEWDLSRRRKGDSVLGAEAA